MKPSPVLLTLATLVMLGCSGNAGSTETGAPSPAPSTSNDPTATSNPSEPNAETVADPASSQSKQQSPVHFERTYQLSDLKKVAVKANGHTLTLWVMDTDGKRREGMMWLEKGDVKPNEGMIFVFPEEAPQAFWMENTLLPLDIIYVTKGKKVDSIVHGKPKDRTSLPSKGNAIYVIELLDGRAAKLGIKPGMTLGIPDSVKAIE